MQGNVVASEGYSNTFLSDIDPQNALVRNEDDRFDLQGIGAPRSFEPPSQDPISSRRLAGEEQEGLQEEADGGKASPSIIFNGQPEDAPFRYLSRRFVGRSGVPTNVNPRPDVLNQAVPRSAGSQGLINGQPMPNYAVPPPIFGLPDQSAVAKDDANEWFDRWIRPFVRQ